MSRLHTILLAGALIAAVAVLSAHLTVERTFPVTDSTLTTAPARVQVWFSQHPTLAISTLALQGPSGPVALGKVTAGQADGKPDRSLVAPIDGTLAAGVYTATWKTAGNDGHVQTGTFTFTYAPGGR